MKETCDRAMRALSVAIGLLCAGQLCLWLPFYLALPWYSDHDVFATMAHSWDAGILPYRDLISNNFPGTIYLFWCLGKLFGWGKTPSLYIFDSTLLMLLGFALVYWSHVRFQRMLPGLIGFLTVLSYYLSLDFSQTAQRDWHAPLFAVIGILSAQCFRGRIWGVLPGVIGVSLGLLIRPQVVLLVPALVALAVEVSRRSGDPWKKTIIAVVGWSSLLVVLTLLGFVPLMRAGVFDDFLGGLRILAYGGQYNEMTLGKAVIHLITEVCDFRIIGLLYAIPLLDVMSRTVGVRATAAVWFIALLGVIFYAPVGPVVRPYQFHPLWLVWSINIAVISGMILGSKLPIRWQFLSILLVLGIAATGRPRYCRPGPVRDVISALCEGREPTREPAAYHHPYVSSFDLTPWKDYVALLDYLRHKTTPNTLVASLLMGIAITGPAARFSALPAESATWLYVVAPREEDRFIKALEDAGDSVVIWDPNTEGGGTVLKHHYQKMNDTVSRLYAPEASFGLIELWRRRPGL
jgi:hypothetical protein